MDPAGLFVRMTEWYLNKTGRGIHKIIIGVLWSLLSALKDKITQEDFSTYIHHESFKTDIMKCKLIAVSHTEFQQNLWKCLYEIYGNAHLVSYYVSKYAEI